jgi:hypothetical protein
METANETNSGYSSNFFPPTCSLGLFRTKQVLPSNAKEAHCLTTLAKRTLSSKKNSELDVMEHVCNPSTQEAEARGFMSLRPAWAI